MKKYLIMLLSLFLFQLTFCVVTQGTYIKTLFDYNINPSYDLIAQESSSYSNFSPITEFDDSPQLRYKHQARGRGYGKSHGNRKYEIPPYTSGLSGGYNYHDGSEEYSGENYHSHHFHHPHPHGIPPGQAKKHHHPHGHPHIIPPRFPPPPVYDKNFLNPWTFSATTSKQFQHVQQPPLTTPRPFFVQQPPTRKMIAITTPAPFSSTQADDQLMYDIDVRFGRE